MPRGKKITLESQIKIGSLIGWMSDCDGWVEAVAEFNPEFRHDATVADVKAGRRGKGALSFTVCMYAEGLGFYPNLALMLGESIYLIE